MATIAELLNGRAAPVLGMASNPEYPTINYYGLPSQSAPRSVVDGKIFYNSFSAKVYTGNDRRESYLGQGWADPAWYAAEKAAGKIVDTKGGFLVDPSIVFDPKFSVVRNGTVYRNNADLNGSLFTQVRDAVESVGVAVGNYFLPGSSLLTSNLVSNGAQSQLNTTLGKIANLGSGIYGGWSGNLSNYGTLWDKASSVASPAATTGQADSSWLLGGKDFPATSGLNTTGLSNYIAPDLGATTAESALKVGTINTTGLSGFLAPSLTIGDAVSLSASSPWNWKTGLETAGNAGKVASLLGMSDGGSGSLPNSGGLSFGDVTAPSPATSDALSKMADTSIMPTDTGSAGASPWIVAAAGLGIVFFLLKAKRHG